MSRVSSSTAGRRGRFGSAVARVAGIGMLVASHTLAVAVGGLAGGWGAQRSLAKAQGTDNAMVLSTRYATEAALQRSSGGARYHDALLAFLTAIDRIHAPNDPLYSDTTYFTDKTLTYVRLARVERGAGNPGTPEKYLSEAVSSCVRISWKDCTPERLVEVSERLEQQSLFGGKDEKAAGNPNQPAPPDSGHEALGYD